MERKSCILLRKNKTILDLNVYCLFAIFKQIKNNCELSKNKDRYRDLIFFAISNDHIRSVFIDWNNDLWTLREVKKACLLTSEIVSLNLTEIYESIRPYTKAEKQKFWDIICTSLAENTGLRSCLLSYVQKSYYSEHMEIFERIIKILQAKSSLKMLDLHMATYRAEYLEGFRNLQGLVLFTPMDAESLVRCIKANPNLKELGFLSTEIHGKLADIAPFSQNIEYLNIQMKLDLNAIEYVPLTKLPKLSHLALRGYPQADSLSALFKSMAENGSLRTLLVDQPLESEIEELSKVHHLELLECELKAPPSDLSPTHSWRWPIACALDLKCDSREDKKLDHISVHILSSKGVLGLTSADMTFIKRMLLRLNNWYRNSSQNHNFDSTPVGFELNELLSTVENLKGQDIRNLKDITTIATYALLKALKNQWPTHARKIQLLARIGNLKELRVKVKLNIEKELLRLKESDIRFNVEDFEKEIPIDSDTQEIMHLNLLAYLNDALVSSKFAKIKSDIVLRHLEMEINFDIRP